MKSLWLAVALFSVQAQAAVVPELSQYFEQKLDQVEQSACQVPDNAIIAQNNLVLQDINIDITPTVTFGINSVLSLALSPEIDFVLVKNGQN
jgi:hypothetical protein